MATDLSNWAPFEILAGPADVYVGDFGVSFPTVDERPDSGDFTYIGETEGGVTVRHTQTVTPLTTDQHTGAVKAVRTEEGLEIEFSIVDLTLENYSLALNSTTVTADPGGGGDVPTKSLAFHQGIHVDLRTLLVRGRSPYGNFPAQYQVPVVYQNESPEVSFVKDDKSVLACVWNALEDLDADEGEQFGTLVAQTAVS